MCRVSCEAHSERSENSSDPGTGTDPCRRAAPRSRDQLDIRRGTGCDTTDRSGGVRWQGRPCQPRIWRTDDAQRTDVRTSWNPVCLPFVRRPLVRECRRWSTGDTERGPHAWWRRHCRQGRRRPQAGEINQYRGWSGKARSSARPRRLPFGFEPARWPRTFGGSLRFGAARCEHTTGRDLQGGGCSVAPYGVVPDRVKPANNWSSDQPSTLSEQ
jgi:hypothetical protein